LNQAVKTVICRHCGEPFNPAPGKPGYVDECAPCLHERTRPREIIPTEFERKSALLRAALKKKGFPDDFIDVVIVATRQIY